MINTIHTNQSSYAAITTNGIILHNYTGNYAIFTDGWDAMYIAFKQQIILLIEGGVAQ